MKFSIIIPVRNGGPRFAACLAAAQRAAEACRDLAGSELIVVDDGSGDASAATARAAGALVLATPAPGGQGPAAARNLGARSASGDIAFFVDADVALHADALRLAAQAFAAEPALEACFGSYDDAPAAPNFLSQYKNLLHHYVHQHASSAASTFWTGCGAIRLASFAALGGFDAETYRRPSIEDIDLGYRLRRHGGQIRLIKAMQCAHLKRWTAASLLRSDVFERGIPWTVLLWRESRARKAVERHKRSDDDGHGRPLLMDLNLQTTNRLSVALTALLVVAAALMALPLAGWLRAPAVATGAPLAAVVLSALLLALNWPLYAFFARKRGLAFALAAIPWHWLYYLYNSLSFALGSLRFLLRGVRPVAADGALPAERTRASKL